LTGGKKLSGLDNLPYPKARHTYEFIKDFRSGECDMHDIYLATGEGARHEHTAKLEPIKVKCSNPEYKRKRWLSWCYVPDGMNILLDKRSFVDGRAADICLLVS